MFVLIETYWNVKPEGAKIWKTADGINRNILECKMFLKRRYTYVRKCINRNILECKTDCGRTQECIDRVLIETYWNVKECQNPQTWNPSRY